MADKIQYSIVLVAGALLGGLGLAVVLLLSGVEIPMSHWTAHPAGSASSDAALTERPGSPAYSGPGAGRIAPFPAQPGDLRQPSAETDAPPAILRLGPVPSDVATNIVGDLTLGGFTIRDRSVVNVGSQSQVITVGPHSRSTIEGIAERLRRKFPGVPFTIVAVR